MAGKVIFRADASRDLGHGHVIRCLTLADALAARGAHCVFVCRTIPRALAAAVASRGHELKHLAEEKSPGQQPAASQEADARATLDIIGGAKYDWLVVDHYGLEAAWEAELRRVASRVLVVDDLVDRRHDCDLFLDQNLAEPEATTRHGRVAEKCRLLLGPRFALLRDDFRRCRMQVRPRSGEVRRVLVAFGGTDTHNHTAMALDALERLRRPQIAVDVVIGAEHPKRTELERAGGDRIVVHVQTERMAELMAGADLAIAAGGSSTWERCCLGVPSLVLAAADNQVRVVRDAARAGVAYELAAANLDAEALAGQLRFVADNERLRESISKAAMALVDGHGTARVARAMGFFLVTIRRAVAADAENLFAWRNHPDVRSASHSAGSLEWADHVRWLGSVLLDPACVLVIAQAGGSPAGVIRFDMTESVARVSIYAVPGRDSRIRGAEMLAAAELWLIQNRPEVQEFTATVLEGNIASHRMFANAGFTRDSSLYRKRVT